MLTDIGEEVDSRNYRVEVLELCELADHLRKRADELAIRLVKLGEADAADETPFTHDRTQGEANVRSQQRD
jgi:hypothetical protein